MNFADLVLSLAIVAAVVGWFAFSLLDNEPVWQFFAQLVALAGIAYIVVFAIATALLNP